MFIGQIVYSRPFMIMAINSQIPIRAAAKKPIIPIKEMPKKSGGISEMTISAEPISSAAIMIANEIRLLI